MRKAFRLRNWVTITLLLCSLNARAQDKVSESPTDAVERAIAAVSSPPPTLGLWKGNMSPFELQVYYRLRYLWHGLDYKYEASHAERWEKFVLNESNDIYGRLCGAYYLLEEKEGIRHFIQTQVGSRNLRHRYNAAKMVEMYVARDTQKKWGVDVLIKLLAEGTIDGSVVTSPPAGEFPQGDRNDILMTPIDDICWSLGFMKEKKAVPALISVLERRPRTSGAAFALGEIGDKRAIPILMKVLKDHSGYDDREVTALGKLQHKEAVPILISRIGKPRTTFSGMDIIETEKILEALLEIGDTRATEPIERYLQGDYPKKSKAVARRVLVQLKSDDPVEALIALLDKETYEPERSDIISALVKNPDNRVVKELASIARTSGSAFMRREAILGLRDIGNRKALLLLASLLDITFPKDLKAEWGWKGIPDFQKYFPDTIQMCLKQRTEQDFGKDRTKWEDWITKNVGPKDALDKK